jgi:hypothetical protein
MLRAIHAAKKILNADGERFEIYDVQGIMHVVETNTEKWAEVLFFSGHVRVRLHSGKNVRVKLHSGEFDECMGYAIREVGEAFGLFNFDVFVSSLLRGIPTYAPKPCIRWANTHAGQVIILHNLTTRMYEISADGITKKLPDSLRGLGREHVEFLTR